ncbi:pterin-4-alpha-carbinolamine dehydratase [Sinobaca qinghaiensis]|uniref:4a-hydroxytetrahydrobiopterin dehydratase n=1 Tax=Sinobaca qinghaiensis TaxID=342944 RepID=A0A419V6M2_9BACL|nr:4a-hydroxytetrahydrobiopterin dehydratase [Sinobaca qinghaiensis]RKD75633.1 pterin-4-alpha-carbinolamine dehydratase [Sinobaca qinghaiensis]
MTLNNEEIENYLQTLNGWERKDAKTLERRFQFDAFPTGIRFVDQLAEHAENVQHHPEIIINYTNISIRLCTHDAGGITMKDIESAEAYNKIFDQQSF